MRAALGLKAHSGWDALVAIGAEGAEFKIVDRRRIELVEDRDADWAGPPYHAADGLPPAQSRRVVGKGIEAARRSAIGELKSAVERARSAGRRRAIEWPVAFRPWQQRGRRR